MCAASCSPFFSMSFLITALTIGLLATALDIGLLATSFKHWFLSNGNIGILATALSISFIATTHSHGDKQLEKMYNRN